MLHTPPLYTNERKKSDMEDLEMLGSITFDLKMNKEKKIKNSFISLVSKLGTKEFLLEYTELYKTILARAEERKEECMLFSNYIPTEAPLMPIPNDSSIFPSILDTDIFSKISISSTISIENEKEIF